MVYIKSASTHWLPVRSHILPPPLHRQKTLIKYERICAQKYERDTSLPISDFSRRRRLQSRNLPLITVYHLLMEIL